MRSNRSRASFLISLSMFSRITNHLSILEILKADKLDSAPQQTSGKYEEKGSMSKRYLGIQPTTKTERFIVKAIFGRIYRNKRSMKSKADKKHEMVKGSRGAVLGCTCTQTSVVQLYKTCGKNPACAE